MPRRRGQPRQNKSSNKKYRNVDLDIGNGLYDIDFSRFQLHKFQKKFIVSGQDKISYTEVQKFRNQNQIILKAICDVPDPFIEWNSFYFTDTVVKKLQEDGYPNPTPFQAQRGYDILGVGQSGTGKSLGFLLPSIVHIGAQAPVQSGEGPIGLILTPTRETALKLQSEFNKYGQICCGISSQCIHGGDKKEDQQDVLNRGFDLMIATPGRLVEFLLENSTNLRRVTYLVLYQIDKMIAMGFMFQIERILGQIRPDRQLILIASKTSNEIERFTRLKCSQKPIHLIAGDTSNKQYNHIEQKFEVCSGEEKKDKLQLVLKDIPPQDQVIIFCHRKIDCDTLSAFLNSKGLRSLCLHKNLNMDNKNFALFQYKNKNIQILFVIDIDCKAHDVQNPQSVIFYDFPRTIDDYIRRICLSVDTGTQKGKSLAFFDPKEDAVIILELLQYLQDQKISYPPQMDTIKPLVGSNFQNNQSIKKEYWLNDQDRRDQNQGRRGHGGSRSRDQFKYNKSSNNNRDIHRNRNVNYDQQIIQNQQQQQPYYPEQQIQYENYPQTTDYRQINQGLKQPVQQLTDKNFYEQAFDMNYQSYSKITYNQGQQLNYRQQSHQPSNQIQQQISRFYPTAQPLIHQQQYQVKNYNQPIQQYFQQINSQNFRPQMQRQIIQPQQNRSNRNNYPGHQF